MYGEEDSWTGEPEFIGDHLSANYKGERKTISEIYTDMQQEEEAECNSDYPTCDEEFEKLFAAVDKLEKEVNELTKTMLCRLAKLEQKVYNRIGPSIK